MKRARLRTYIAAVTFGIASILAGIAQGATLYIDFGGTLSVPAPGSDGRYWNNADGSINVASGTLTGLVDENNTPTTVDLVVTVPSTSENYGYNLGATQSSLVDWPTQATGDDWGIYNSTTPTGGFRLGGLTPGASYKMTLYGGRGITGARALIITNVTNGGTCTLQTAGEAVGVLIGTADANGHIELGLANAPSNDNGRLCAMSIENVVPVPLTGTAYIDFGGTLTVPTPDSQGRYWNNADGSVNVASGTLTNLVDEDSTPTTVNLVVTDPSTSENYGYNAGATQSSLVDWPTQATGDNWGIYNSTTPTGGFRLEGLTPGASYKMTMYGARFTGGTGARILVITNVTNGGTLSLSTYTEDVGVLVGTADANGHIELGLANAPGNDAGHLCAMSIERVYPPLSGTAYIDFGGTLSVPAPGSDGRYWNNANGSVNVASGTLRHLVDENNNPTAVALVVTDPSWSDNYGYNLGTKQSSLVDWPTQATGDEWAIGVNSDLTGGVRLEGLTPGVSYKMTFYGGRNTSFARYLIITNITNGGTLTLHTTVEDVGVLDGIADANGYIELGFTKTPESDIAHLCAMSINALRGTVVVLR